MVNHTASFAILVYQTHCEQKSITEHYHSVQKLSFSTSVTRSAVLVVSFVNQIDVITIHSYVAYVTLSLTVLSHALNYVSQQLCLLI